MHVRWVLPLLQLAGAARLFDLSAANGTILVGGRPFAIKGVSWFGMENAEPALGGLDARSLGDILDFLSDHKFNAIRVPLSADSILSNSRTNKWLVSEALNPGLRDAPYFTMLDALVEEAATRGMLILLDMHRLEAAKSKYKLWYDAASPESEVAWAWQQVAVRYCGSWNILGADVFNEPTEVTWGYPDGYSNATNWMSGATVLGNAVLAKCPDWLVFMSGAGQMSIGCNQPCRATSPHSSLSEVAACLDTKAPFECPATPDQTSYRHFWAGNLEAAGRPGGTPELAVPSRLVLAAHLYGPSVYNQSYFYAPDYPANMPTIWDAQFASAGDQSGVPVVVTEWGGWFVADSSDVPNQARVEGYTDAWTASDIAWQETFLAFLQTRNLSSFYWCLNPNSKDTGGLVGYDWRVTPGSIEARKLEMLSGVAATNVFDIVSIPPQSPPPPPVLVPPPPPAPYSATRLATAWAVALSGPIGLMLWMLIAFKRRNHFATAPPDHREQFLSPEASQPESSFGSGRNTVSHFSDRKSLEEASSARANLRDRWRRAIDRSRVGATQNPASVATQNPASLAQVVLATRNLSENSNKSNKSSNQSAESSSHRVFAPQWLGKSKSSFGSAFGLMHNPHVMQAKKVTLAYLPISRSRPSKRGRFYFESRPVRGTRYFPENDTASTACVVCLYNEQDHELQRTLDTIVGRRSLDSTTARNTPPAPALDIVVIADGLEKMSESMKWFLSNTFKLEASLFNRAAWQDEDSIFISNAIDVEQCRLSLLIKCHNLKKINSHEWFFTAHVPNTGCPLALTTDTGAYFRPGTLAQLADHLLTTPKCVALTGRQRVMSYEHQKEEGYDEEGAGEAFFDWILRALQGYDFEMDHVAGKAANCAAGLVPCLHGPCALFRYADVDGQTLHEYFMEWGYAAPHTLGLLGANLQLAEDRIPSLLSVIYSGKHSNALFEAVFEFEAELSLRALVTQRRRWGNGSLAGLVYALTQANELLHSPGHSYLYRVSNILVILVQTIGFACTFIFPGIFGYLFSTAAGVLTAQLPPDITSPGFVGTVTGVVSGLHVALYVAFVFVHVKRGTNDCILQPTLYVLMVLYNAMGTLLVVAALLLDATLRESWFVMILFAAASLSPFVIAAVSSSGEAVRILMHSFPVYFLATPTLVATVPAYNLTRLADLSWGNRPAGSQPTGGKAEKSTAGHHERWMKRQLRGCQRLNALVVVANLLLMGFLTRIASVFAFLPETPLSGTVPAGGAAFDGVLEFCFFLAAPFYLQQVVAIVYHALRSTGRCLGIGTKAPQLAEMSDSEASSRSSRYSGRATSLRPSSVRESARESRESFGEGARESGEEDSTRNVSVRFSARDSTRDSAEAKSDNDLKRLDNSRPADPVTGEAVHARVQTQTRFSYV